MNGKTLYPLPSTLYPLGKLIFNISFNISFSSLAVLVTPSR